MQLNEVDNEVEGKKHLEQISACKSRLTKQQQKVGNKRLYGY